MNMQIPSISPARIYALQSQDKGVEIIDVRTPGEYRSGHIEGAKSLPLDELHPEKLWKRNHETDQDSERTVYLTCQSGLRARQAAERLVNAGHHEVMLVEGGTQAWEKAGLPTKRHGNAISIERQVQIAIGSLIVLKVIFGFTVHELFFALSALIGSGLIIAGVTRWCGMARLIARMPWNRDSKCTEGAAV